MDGSGLSSGGDRSWEGDLADPMPLSARQLCVLGAVVARELGWGLRSASGEIHRWRARALSISQEPIRADALQTFAHKRTHILGAALFSILPRHRDRRLLRLLVAYEIILEFLDNVHERAAGLANGQQLHRALIEALDPTAPISDYYREHPWKDDGGFLRELVGVCREDCASLPGYPQARELLLQGARRCAQAQSLNHEVGCIGPHAGLREWAQSEFHDQREASWWELTAAASSSIGIHVLLALAASSTPRDWEQVNAAYVPWLCAVSTLLDSYTDRSRDLLQGNHSYLSYYPNPRVAVERMAQMITRGAVEARRLPDGDRHAVIAASMVAMYLSNDTVRAADTSRNTDELVRAGGSLTMFLLPVLRGWRVLSAQRTT